LPLIPIDGTAAESGGQVLRAALTLSTATGQGFEMSRIREKGVRPGLRPEHVAAVRAVALVSSAEVHGAFDGSPDLRFEPGAVSAGDFRFEMGGAEPTSLLLETVIPVLGLAAAPSRVEVTGGTHVPQAPSFDFLARHWSAVVSDLGLPARLEMVRAGFAPRGEGEVRATVSPWRRPNTLALEDRGRLLEVRGLSASSRIKDDVARRQRDSAQALLWEERRIEASWEVVEVEATSPGAFLFVEAVFERGRAAFSYLGERGMPSEVLGERAARRLLRFIEEEEGAVDPFLCDQLAVPLALSRGGGRVTTPEVTGHLEAVAGVIAAFGIAAAPWGRRGGPGGLEVGPC
jgi:RNA 3'-terminal phosphate cyclase (ATP)